MTDRPILFSGPMVRALLAGRKTQTRRVIKPQPHSHMPGMWRWDGPLRGGGRMSSQSDTEGMAHGLLVHVVSFDVGDRLWVREAWRSSAAYDDLAPSDMGGEEPIQFEADGERDRWTAGTAAPGRLRAGMHMVRWASRLTLNVTDVRVQRLQEITEADAMAEGVAPLLVPPDGGSAPCTEGYRVLWDSLNSERGFGWDTNPWVVAVTFAVRRGNIDQMAKAA